MKKTKLFLDFDGCIVNSIKAIVDLYNEDFQHYDNFHPVHWWDINTWNFSECSCASSEYINQYFNQQRFFDKLEFMTWAKEVIIALENMYEISIVTHGYSPNLILKQLWIKSHFPNIKFIGVDLKECRDKSCVDMSGAIFIDDNVKNFKNCNAKKMICFGEKYTWNYDWKGKRLINWRDVYKELIGGEKIVF